MEFVIFAIVVCVAFGHPLKLRHFEVTYPSPYTSQSNYVGESRTFALDTNSKQPQFGFWDFGFVASEPYSRDGTFFTVIWVADENGNQFQDDNSSASPPNTEFIDYFAATLIDATLSYADANGINLAEAGGLNLVGPKPEEIETVSKGSYSYIQPEGTVITVNWVADENGFQATGDHLPTPPPMPEH